MTKGSRWVAGALVGLAMMLPAGARAAEIVYQNDSFGETPEGEGGVECGFAVDEKFGALFVPQATDYPFEIRSIRFALFPYRLVGAACEEVEARTGIPVTVEIWNDPLVAEAPAGDPIYSSTEWTAPSSLSGMIELPVGDDAVLSVTEGVVRVAVTIRADDAMPIRDHDGIVAERNLIYDIGGTWHWSSDYAVSGDWLLRLVVDTVPGPEPDEVEPAPDAGLDAIDDPDALDDVFEDVPVDGETDASSDATEHDDARLGGGGCACGLEAASPSQSTALAMALLLLAGLAATRRRPPRC